MALTSLDLGDIFLTVISTQSFETSLRSITFREFGRSPSLFLPLRLPHSPPPGADSMRIGRIPEDEGSLRLSFG
jgi:hypothetical protein